MLKPALQKVATQKGIKFTNKTTKDELIQLIEGNTKKAKVGEKFAGEY